MAITNLLGTTWRVPVGWSAVAGYGVFYVDYEARLQIASNYTVQFYNGARIGIGCTTNNAATQDIADRIYFSTSNSTHSIKPPAGNIRSITFWGGADLTNPDLISWLEEYGELVSIKKYTLLCSGNTAYSSNEKRFRKLLMPGLYDADDNLVASWNALTTTYGMNCEADYTSPTYNTDSASPCYVLNNNSALASGVKLIISNCITKIGNFAFRDCTSLESITIPQSVNKFGASAFENCTFEYVYYTGDMAHWCGIDCFSGDYIEDEEGSSDKPAIIEITTTGSPCCADTNLYIDNELVEDVVIPYGVTSIGNCAFRHCSTLKSVTIPNSVTSIGNSVFAFCTSLTNATLADSITNIGKSMFAGCSSLTSANIPNGMTYVPYGMFMETAITSIIIPDSVKIIEYAAFQLCKKLSSIVIPDSVTVLEQGAFLNCSSLKSVTGGNGLTSIGYACFTYDPITSITIPDSVTHISMGAFYGTSLTSATFKDTTTWYATSTEGATSGTNLSSSSLASTSTAATYLKSTYAFHYWYKK